MRFGATAVLILAVVQSAAAQSNLTITAVRMTGTNVVEIAWPSVTNHWYRLEQTTNLETGAWETLFPSTLATVPTNTYGMTIETAGPMFWRVVSDRADAYFNDIGTEGDDTLVVFGTTNRDWIAQSGLGNNDSLYTEGNSGDDWIEQYGQEGADYLDAYAGTGDDLVAQFGGIGPDVCYVDSSAGNDRIVQQGEGGDDTLSVDAAAGNDVVQIVGGEGDDAITICPGEGDDSAAIDAGPGLDEMTHSVGAGSDVSAIDGGPDNDTLTIHSNNQSFTVYDAQANIMYQTGVGGSAITVLNVEHGTIIGNDGITPVYSW